MGAWLKHVYAAAMVRLPPYSVFEPDCSLKNLTWPDIEQRVLKLNLNETQQKSVV